MSKPIKHVVVVGAGTMGSGIAMVVAATGHTVTLVDVNQQVLDKSRSEIERNSSRMARKLHKDDAEAVNSFTTGTLSRIKYDTNLEGAVKSTDLVIEAIVESMSAKQELFRRIDSVAPQHVIFASNTSSLSIEDMGAVTKREDRFIGFHFFNPVPLMKLIEVIKTGKTSEETNATMLAFGRALGKTCISCKDTPGFIVNRMLFSITGEALAMLERGDATTRDIDTALKLGLGHPMGPFELMDMIGLDVVLSIVGENDAVSKLVSKGKLGVKSGEGFYSYK